MNSANRSSSKESKQQPCSGVFRSEEMLLCQLFLRSDVAFQATCRLGELGNLFIVLFINQIMIFVL